MEVTISPEDISAHIAKAVVDSVVGEQVKTAIENVFRERYSTANIVDKAVQSAVEDQVRRYVIELLSQRADVIRALVVEKFTEDVQATLVGKIIASMSAGSRY